MGRVPQSREGAPRWGVCPKIGRVLQGPEGAPRSRGCPNLGMVPQDVEGTPSYGGAPREAELPLAAVIPESSVFTRPRVYATGKECN